MLDKNDHFDLNKSLSFFRFFIINLSICEPKLAINPIGEVIMESSIIYILCIGISAFLIGFSKSSVGGLVIVVVPLVAIAVPGPESTGLILPMMVAADFFAAVSYFRACQWSVFFRIFPVTAIGVVIGYLIMGQIPRDVFGSILGGIILLMLIVGWIVEKKPIAPLGNKMLTWVVGICAGISTMIANAAGPLMGIYLLQQRMPKDNFVGTRSVFFLLLNLFKLPFSSSLGLVTLSSLEVNLYALPLIIIGAVIGIFVLKHINITLFKTIVRLAATISACRLIFA